MTPRVLARITGQFWPESATGLPAVAVIGPDGVAVTTGAVDARLPLASVTKPLVAYAVLVAVEEGSLALDAALTADAGTSLRHLLAHASGMAPDERTLVAPPATRRIYSNAGFEIVGDLLADATGLAIAEYLREAVLVPARDGRDNASTARPRRVRSRAPPTSLASRQSCSHRR